MMINNYLADSCQGAEKYSKKNKCDISIVLYNRLISKAVRYVIRDHTVLRATHTFIHKWNEPCLSLHPSCRASSLFG